MKEKVGFYVIHIQITQQIQHNKTTHMDRHNTHNNNNKTRQQHTCEWSGGRNYWKRFKDDTSPFVSPGFCLSDRQENK